MPFLRPSWPWKRYPIGFCLISKQDIAFQTSLWILGKNFSLEKRKKTTKNFKTLWQSLIDLFLQKCRIFFQVQSRKYILKVITRPLTIWTPSNLQHLRNNFRMIWIQSLQKCRILRFIQIQSRKYIIKVLGIVITGPLTIRTPINLQHLGNHFSMIRIPFQH